MNMIGRTVDKQRRHALFPQDAAHVGKQFRPHIAADARHAFLGAEGAMYQEVRKRVSHVVLLEAPTGRKTVAQDASPGYARHTFPLICSFEPRRGERTSARAATFFRPYGAPKRQQLVDSALSLTQHLRAGLPSCAPCGATNNGATWRVTAHSNHMLACLAADGDHFSDVTEMILGYRERVPILSPVTGKLPQFPHFPTDLTSGTKLV